MILIRLYDIVSGTVHQLMTAGEGGPGRVEGMSKNWTRSELAIVNRLFV